MKIRVVRAAGALAVALWSIFVAAQDCFQPVGRFPYGTTVAVVNQGSIAFVGNGAALMVVDLTVPDAPTHIAELAFAERIMSLAVDGDRLYVGTRQGLHVVDISQLTEPVIVGELHRVWVPNDMTASGNVLCVHEQGLFVFDVSDPSMPVEASIRPLDYDEGIELVGQHAFLTSDGLEVLDISNPYTPVLVASLPGIHGRLDAEGHRLYAASDDHFRVVDISDPSLPVVLGSASLSDTVKDVSAAGELVFVSTAIHGLRVVDVEDPTDPTVVGIAPMPAGSVNERWLKVAALGNVAVVATWDHGVRVISAADPSNPIEIGVIDSVALGESGAFSNDAVFIAALDRGLRVVDVSDPTEPVELTILDLGGQTGNVTAVGDLVYTASPRLSIIDASDPSQPEVIGEDPAIWGEGIDVVDGLAYVATWFGLRVIDVSATAAPVEIGSINLGNDNWRSVDVLGTLAVVWSGATIAIVDVSDPAHPVLRSSIGPAWSLTGPVLHRSYLLFAGGASLFTYHISDPDNPIQVNQLPLMRGVSGFSVAGSVAYLGTYWDWAPDFETWVEAWDIGDPESPVFLGQRADVGAVNQFVFDRDRVFTIRSDSGFDTFSLCQGPLFADGFETGDTSAWERAVP